MTTTRSRPMRRPFSRNEIAQGKHLPHRHECPAEGNHCYQRDLAKALVANLGFNAALETCASNGWEGIMRELRVDRSAASIDAQGYGSTGSGAFPQ